MPKQSFTSFVALAQGAYYLLTGVWPIVSRSSFEKITGPKVDFWLVRTVGALISVIGGVLLMFGLRNKVTLETALLGVGSAASLGGSDVIYSAKGRISPVYMLESVAEAGLIVLWLIGLNKDRLGNEGLEIRNE